VKKKESCRRHEKDTLENDDTITKLQKPPLLILNLKRVLTDNGRFGWHQTLCPIHILFIFHHNDTPLMDRPTCLAEFFLKIKNKNVTHTAMYKGKGPRLVGTIPPRNATSPVRKQKCLNTTSTQVPEYDTQTS
jgi:hypothetical protein